jgi:chaperonin GroEL
MTIVDGGGDREAIRERARMLRRRLQSRVDDSDDRYRVRQRLGWLTGGVGILQYGTNSEQERKHKAEEIKNSLTVLSDAMHEGVVPGGGVAYLNCIPAVRALQCNGDEAVGIDIFARALEAPMQQIISNAGQHAPVVIARARRRGPTYGYNAVTEEIVDMQEAGVMDSVGVLSHALSVAASGACMALTAGAVVLKREPKESVEP